MIDTDISLHLRHGAVNLQAIEIEITIADVKGMGTVLLVVPHLFHTEDQSVKPCETTIVFGANRHVSDGWHIDLLIVGCGQPGLGIANSCATGMSRELVLPGYGVIRPFFLHQNISRVLLSALFICFITIFYSR